MTDWRDRPEHERWQFQRKQRRYTMRTFRSARRSPTPLRPKRSPGDRIVVDFARGTLTELHIAIRARIAEARRAGVEPDHITLIAEKMVREALAK